MGEGDDVSSVGRILLRCLWRPMSLGSFCWGQLPGFGAQPDGSRFGMFGHWSVCVWLKGKGGHPALFNHQAKEQL